MPHTGPVTTEDVRARPEVGRMATQAPAVGPLLLTAREAAAALRISERSLWGLTQRGEVRAVRIGRTVRYDPRDLQSFIDRAKS
jgi:excisionase family DNA binding protein